jgi:hypothetical protein
MSRTRFVLLAAGALTLALGGCGGGARLSKVDYEQKLKAAGQQLVESSRPLAQAKSGPEFVSSVEQVQDALREGADDLDGGKPPEDVEAANDRLVNAMRDLADEFEKVKAAGQSGLKEGRAAGQRLARSQASEEARQAVLEIQRRGYDVGLLGST